MIYVATHKEFDFQNMDGYCPLHVGAEGKKDLGYLRDNNGENISYKNKNYCELTGVYWIMKNSSENVKGLVHYRRYFSDTLTMKILNNVHVNKILSKYDVILPFERKMSHTVLENYKECGYEKDLIMVRKILLKKYPDYIECFDQLLEDHKIRLFNMIIAKKKIFDDYSNWLFDILFELEKQVDLTGYSDYQKRIYGFISERLLNVYFRKNNYKIFQCGVIPTEAKWSLRKRIATGFKRKILYLYQMYLKR